MRKVQRLAMLMVMLLVSSYGLKANDENARMMVHLLDYIAVDYSMAVENGAVINNAEYSEMEEFVKRLAKARR